MFYNALARKGKLDDDTDETDIASVVALHNNMNEKTWQKVLEWEAVLNPTPNSDNSNSSINTPKLLKFTGRPTDLSPKAWFKHYILGHPLPFDRHDWTVLRSDPAHTGGATIRYVIDYYYDESRARQDAASSIPDLNDAHATPSLLIDVRPALDGPTQLWNRIVTMPLARRNFLGNNKTKFEPLPMFPTRDMKSQVSESVSVWQSIQLAAAASKTKEETEGEAGQSDQHSAFKNIPPLNDKDAIELAKNLSRALQECRQAQAAIDNLSDDNDDDDSSSYAKASMDLTICLGKILCPLQHSALTQAARGDNEDKIEAALASLNDCVLLKTTQHEISRRQERQQQQ
jgi:cytochrome c heme-lyase